MFILFPSPSCLRLLKTPHSFMFFTDLTKTNRKNPCILAKVIQETSHPLEMPAPFKQLMG